MNCQKILSMISRVVIAEADALGGIDEDDDTLNPSISSCHTNVIPNCVRKFAIINLSFSGIPGGTAT
jgi:hypothetical protein